MNTESQTQGKYLPITYDKGCIAPLYKKLSKLNNEKILTKQKQIKYTFGHNYQRKYTDGKRAHTQSAPHQYSLRT